MGWENVFHCEWNEFGQKILKYYWPDAISYADITKTDFTIHRGRIDILTGGFPCQPFSLAGKRKGNEDERYLWPAMLRSIREIQPTWVVAENVSGLVNWDGGMVFNQVQADLDAAGYEVVPFLLPAAGVEAPHGRERIWFIAHANSEGCKERLQTGKSSIHESKNSYKGCEFTRIFPKVNWEEFPTQSPVFDRNDGLSDRLDGITLSKWRNETIKGAGNAIVPQLAQQIFKAIEQYERNTK